MEEIRGSWFWTMPTWNAQSQRLCLDVFDQGQICMSSNRIIVDAAAYDSFVEHFVERASHAAACDPNDPHTAIGPIVNAANWMGC